VVHSAVAVRVAGHHQAEMDFEFEADRPGWLALRIPTDLVYHIRSRYEGPGTNLLGKALFAHTSPIYVELDGLGVRLPAAILSLIDELRKNIEEIVAYGQFDDERQREQILDIYRDAIRKLRQPN